jgi:hypothetical protein
MKKKTEKRRVFKGPLLPREEPVYGGYQGLELNEYENMQKKHLRAYLNGDKYFFYKRSRYEVQEGLVNA